MLVWILEVISDGFMNENGGFPSLVSPLNIAVILGTTIVQLKFNGEKPTDNPSLFY